MADTSRHHNPWAQDLYAQALARGHDHPRALRTVGRAWSRIVWRCWQDRVPYDPARHRALQRHVTVTIPTASGPVPDELWPRVMRYEALLNERLGRRPFVGLCRFHASQMRPERASGAAHDDEA